MQTTTSFLETWLVRKNIRAAMQYVSAAPILGKCALPPALTGKMSLSRSDFRGGIQSILTEVAAAMPPEKSLTAMVQPYGAVPSGGPSVNSGQPYDLFSLREYKDATFICKFDDSVSFRKTFERADVWYLTFKFKSRPDLDLILAWAKERGSWRIVSVGPLED